jgi:hypothetical protein
MWIAVESLGWESEASPLEILAAGQSDGSLVPVGDRLGHCPRQACGAASDAGPTARQECVPPRAGSIVRDLRQGWDFKWMVAAGHTWSVGLVTTLAQPG